MPLWDLFPKIFFAISEFHTYPSSPHRAAWRKPRNICKMGLQVWWYICHATVRHAMPGSLSDIGPRHNFLTLCLHHLLNICSSICKPAELFFWQIWKVGSWQNLEDPKKILLWWNYKNWLGFCLNTPKHWFTVDFFDFSHSTSTISDSGCCSSPQPWRRSGHWND